jgi:hypothetical protein
MTPNAIMVPFLLHRFSSDILIFFDLGGNRDETHRNY